MDKDKLDFMKFICRPNDMLVEAMKKINGNTKGIVYVADEEDRLLGSLSDGDIRRWILDKGTPAGTVFDACCRDVKYLYAEEASNSEDFMRVNEIRSVPVLDQNHIIIDVLFIADPFSNNRRKDDSLASVPVIIMAGGKGTRLYPFTKILPKPLIPIGEVPILERILNKFYIRGADNFYLTINYKKEMIKSYFMEITPPYTLHFIEEKVPLGTAGSIRLIQDTFEQPVIITNCDILIEADYGKIMEHHQSLRNDMTIIASSKSITIQYGVLHTGEYGLVTSMEEKPRLSYYINTGMYVVNPEFLDWIPKNSFFHMTNLAEMMIEKRKRVGVYLIDETSFLDMGEFEELRKMEVRINNGYAE